MPDELLPIDVLTELGRVTWAAIILENHTADTCLVIDPADPSTDRRQIGQKIKDAKGVLNSWPASSARDDAKAWLERARLALDRRNAALHASPLGYLKAGRLDLVLGEKPRRGTPHVERPLTVESLSELRSVLEDACARWMHVHFATSAESDRLRQDDTNEGG
jgi:hypothetical protein